MDAIEMWDNHVIYPVFNQIPYLDTVTHTMVHTAVGDTYLFLHGAAITHYKGTMYSSWANSPVDENSRQETLRGSVSRDGGLTWSQAETLAPALDHGVCASHGSYLSHESGLWLFFARFGQGTGSRFPGLQMEALWLDEASGRWVPKGIVADNFWPYEEPKRMPDGNWIMGGQDRDDQAVVAMTRGGNPGQWDVIRLPISEQWTTQKGRNLIFAETTVIADEDGLTAIIRNSNGPHALVSHSGDGGRTWTDAEAGNFPMVDSKAYAGVLSTGQRYLISNTGTRDTLTIAVGRSGAKTLSKIWKIRQGTTLQPRFGGFAKSPQWSYPYAAEHDGKLYVVYSLGKEDCELSIIPLTVLHA